MKKLKELRKQAGLTQAELGRLSGLSGVTINRYEKGIRQPKYPNIIKISNALGVMPDEWAGDILDVTNGGNTSMLTFETVTISTREYERLIEIEQKYNKIKGLVND